MILRARHVLVGVAGFVLVLWFVTLRANPAPADLSRQERASARRACQDAVRARLPGARFPHDATVEARDGGRLLLSGSVDAGSPSQSVRRNYQCLLRRDAAAGHAPDSVAVWQSH